MRLFVRFPILFFILAVYLISNDIFHYVPAQVNTGYVRILAPGVCIFFGFAALLMRGYVKKQDAKQAQMISRK